jgi:hypothetical protein
MCFCYHKGSYPLLLPFRWGWTISVERTISSSLLLEMSGARGSITAFARLLVSELVKPLDDDYPPS